MPQISGVFAVDFARLLLAHKRFHDAQLIIRTAFEEGLRYDLYEMRAATTHSNQEKLWEEVHEALGVKRDKGSAQS